MHMAHRSTVHVSGCNWLLLLKPQQCCSAVSLEFRYCCWTAAAVPVKDLPAEQHSSMAPGSAKQLQHAGVQRNPCLL
jgi:hypothetical protein